MELLGTPIDLGRVTCDAYVVAGVADHITPWENCYATTQLLGGDTRFVLSSSGHVAALVNPPGNPKARYRTAPAGANPASAHDWADGRRAAQRHLVGGLGALARRALRSRAPGAEATRRPRSQGARRGAWDLRARELSRAAG